VKPANMLINKDGAVKLCDLGICGNLSNTKLDFSTIVGSTAYLPPKPEQCAIQGDMWALGISLLEIINGEHPFADDASYGLDLKCLTWEPTIPATISDDVQEFILQL
jgi:serine/threonine protein kinase